MNEDQDSQMPDFIVDFFNSLYLLSKIESKKEGYKKFNFALFLIANDVQENLEHHFLGNAETDLDTEVLISLIWKNSEIIEKKTNLKSKQPIAYPKPKQISDNYFDIYNEQLSMLKEDLESIYKKYNYSYCFILYKDDIVKFIYKMKQDVANLHCNSIYVIAEYARANLMGMSVDDIIEEMDEDGMEILNDDEEDSFLKQVKNQGKNLLEEDDDEFNKH